VHDCVDSNVEVVVSIGVSSPSHMYIRHYTSDSTNLSFIEYHYLSFKY